MGIYKKSAIVLAFNWILIPLNFLTGAIIARALGPEGKGIIFLLTGLSAVLVSLLSFGLPTAVVYYYKQKHNPLDKVFFNSTLIEISSVLICGLAFIFLSDDFIRFFIGNTEKIRANPIWIWITIATLGPSLISPIADVLMIVDGNMMLYAVKRMASSLVGIFLTWFLTLVLSWGVIGVLISQLMGAITAFVIVVVWLFGKKISLNFTPSVNGIKDLLKVGSQQYSLSLIAMVAKRIDTFLIASMLNIQGAGYFSIAYTFLTLLTDLPKATIWPLVSALSGKESQEDTKQITMNSRIQFSMMFFLVVLSALLVPSIIRLVYGNAFIPATGATLAILPAALFYPLIVSGNAYFTSLGKPGLLLLPSIVATLAQVVTSVTLLPRIGIIGNSLGYTINQVIVAIWSVYLVTKHTRSRSKEVIFMSRKDFLLLANFGVNWLKKKLAILK